MKKSIFIFACFLLVSIFVFNNSQVYATVGGPTYINEFRYNPLDQSVYYIEQSFSGKGCPPELMKLSLNSGKTEVVYSCDEGEKLVNYITTDTEPTALSEIYKIIDGYKYLSPINLKANKIKVDVNLLNYDKFDPGDNYTKNANFIATVYQDDVKLTDLSITGCNIEQPFTFAGYAIPGLNKKIVLLLSTKSDCFEGGYIGESLYAVSNINNLDRNNYINFYKDNSALSPNEGTLVVFESDKIDVNNTEEKISTIQLENRFSTGVVIIIILISIFIGIILGKSVSKK